ncbi:hypothetical protein HUA74_21665 [Myxococcus sp. CA051A]|uniref:hypothetical protein n=1 Tax=unclassified Myxococcus TaxID=2648731 RepID=UPI00157A768C|nr:MULTISPECIES: hypothetical protein [unclassified Myxococcus]NTX10474.1 hypothetical protein [Myxococcus sp. CA056]NTX63263.1 hypothetical protein [Myxococcus sp. CA051A]
MGDPRNPKRANEPWNPERLRVSEEEVLALAPWVTVSGGWAWHFMAPPHEELKLYHDHKDVDLFVEPSRFPEVVPVLTARGYHRIWTRFDATSTHFYRYARHDAGGKVILDVFVRSVPSVEARGVRVVDPATLLTFYGDIHSTEDCVSVLAARALLAKGESPIGRAELVTRPS